MGGGGIPDQRFAIRTLGARAGGKRRETSGEAGKLLSGRPARVVRVAPEAAMLPVRDQYHFAQHKTLAYRSVECEMSP